MKEIDLLIIQDGKIYPLEFKKTASPGKSDVRDFHVFRKAEVAHWAGRCYLSY